MTKLFCQGTIFLLTFFSIDGYYNVIWNGRSDRGTVVSSGVYLYRLETAHGVVAKKMALVK